MRVLVVANMFPTPNDPSFGSFVRDQVDDLVGLGLEVDVLHFGGQWNRLTYLRAPREVRSRLRSGKYDIVHAHYGLTGATVALARPPIPQLTTFHGSDYAGPPWQRLVSLAVARRSEAIVVSEAGRALLHASRASVIPMGVDTSLFAPRDRRAARRKLGWREDVPLALLAGSRRDPIKRADLFDAAVAVARREVPELESVVLEGYDRAGVALVLNAADVTVVTSDHEGSPLTVRESLACCTPVVTVAVGDVPTVVAGLPGCAVVARDPDALARGIRGALGAARDSSLRERAMLTSRTAVAERVREVYLRTTERAS